MAAPPVVQFLDFGQYKYELTKREKEAKRKQRSVTFKEVRLKPKIGVGDFDTKVRRAIEFLEDGDRVKVAVQFRGRELTHPEIGRNLLAKFAERIKEHGVVGAGSAARGQVDAHHVASTHKPKAHERRAPACRGHGRTSRCRHRRHGPGRDDRLGQTEAEAPARRAPARRDRGSGEAGPAPAPAAAGDREDRRARRPRAGRRRSVRPPCRR